MIVRSGNSQIVQFSHFSVKEFLTANRLAEPIRDVSRYHIRLSAAHTILAQTCLGVLLQLDGRVDRNNIEGFPLARYAAQYWAIHVRFEDVSSSVNDWMKFLFDADKPHFATWLWIWDGDRDKGMSTLRPATAEAVPLYHAARLGFRDLADHLIADHSEHVSAQGGREPSLMHVAARGGYTDIISLLLEHGAAVDDRGIYDQIPLHRASWYANFDAAQCLLDRGADFNARNNDAWTPLFSAVFNGHVEVAQMLLERGAAIDARGSSGDSLLHLAVRMKKIAAVRLLLEHGADVNARDESDRTPPSFARQQEILELFVEYGAEPVN